MGPRLCMARYGPPDSLVEAAEFVRALEKRQGFRIACPEEIDYNAGWIEREQLVELGTKLSKSTYGQYLLHVASGHQ